MVLCSGCVGPEIKHSLCYSLLLKHLKSSEKHWLHPDLTVSELTQRYEQQHLEAEWRSVVVSLIYHVSLDLENLTLLFVQIRPEAQIHPIRLHGEIQRGQNHYALLLSAGQ